METRVGLAWLNREKAVFLILLGLLVVAGTRALCSLPVFSLEPGSDSAVGTGGFFAGAGFPPTGEHRVRRNAPGAISVVLRSSSEGELSCALTGGRPNPFAEWGEAVSVEGTAQQEANGHTESVEEEAGQRIATSYVHPDHKGNRGAVDADRPQPLFEIPVNFRGVEQTPDGVCRVMLERKPGGEYRYLTEGEEWPDIGLTIQSISLTRITLRNGKGETFVMPDLFGSRVRGGIQSPNP